MKKFFTMLAAAMAAFCITSCNKEIVDETAMEDAFSVADMEIDIKVGGFNGADTRAVKSSWETGDQINIWYDNHFTRKPDLVLVYNGGKWSVDTKASVSGAAPKEYGLLNALYVEGGISVFDVYKELTYDDDDWGSFSKKAPDFKTDGSTPAAAMPLYTYVSEKAYSFSSNKLSANLDPWLFSYANNIQIVITDLPAGNWALKCNKFTVASSFDLYNGYVAGSIYSRGTYTLPSYNKDGKAFMFSCTEKNQDLDFTLLNVTTGDVLEFSTTGKSFDSNRLQSFKIPFASFGHKAVDLGLSVKWATMNIGASRPEGCGKYFAWGETQAKEYFAWNKAGDYRWGVYDSNASPGYGMTRYTGGAEGGDGLLTLLPEDDPATVNWGSGWRTPTLHEISELRDLRKCEHIWDEDRQGFIIKGKGTGNSIFLPAAGFRQGSETGAIGRDGYYWTSSLSEYDPCKAYNLSFYVHYFDWMYAYRFTGNPVRAVTDN